MVKKLVCALAVVLMVAGAPGCGEKKTEKTEAERLQKESASGNSMGKRDKELIEEAAENEQSAPAEPAQ